MAHDLAELIKRLPANEQDDARELSENVLFMRRKLKETRQGLEAQAVVVPYDNGGGQAGIRRNPAFDGYRDLLKSYQSALACLRQLLGIDAQRVQPEEKPQSELEKMRNKYKSKYKVVSGGD